MEFLELMRFLLDAKDKFPDLEWGVDGTGEAWSLGLNMTISDENAQLLTDGREMFKDA